jgi:F-type H+-transporting ATPase subunit epsilon
MRLLITDPTRIIADFADIVSVRAEDESGGFGLLEHHADLLTALATAVVQWRHADGKLGYCATRRGVLSMRKSNEVTIATRQAELGDDLDHLEQVVLARFRAELETERGERVAEVRLHMAAIRQIIAALRPARPESVS